MAMTATRQLLSSTYSTTLRRAFQAPRALPRNEPHPALRPPHLHAASLHVRQLASGPGPAESSPPPRPRSLHARRHFERRIVPFSPRQVYDVVADVDEYSHFVPWCTQSAVTQRLGDRLVIADLSVGFRFLSEQYTSVISLDPQRSVNVDVPHSSLFEYLITDWTFEKGSQPNVTNLTFYVEFEFRNPLYQRVTDLFFEEVVKRMVSAFEKRCHAKHPASEKSPGVLHRW